MCPDPIFTLLVIDKHGVHMRSVKIIFFLFNILIKKLEVVLRLCVSCVGAV